MKEYSSFHKKANSLIFFSDWIKISIFPKLMATYHVPEALLMCSSNTTTSSTEDAMGATAWLSLQ